MTILTRYVFFVSGFIRSIRACDATCICPPHAAADLRPMQAYVDHARRPVDLRMDRYKSTYFFVFPHLPIDGLDSDFPLSDNDLGS